MRYEYKVVPAPAKGEKAKGVKTGEARFALALEHLFNDMGGAGWEFQRAETLPSEERSGLTSSVTVWRHVLVFRRALETGEAVRLLAAPEQVAAAGLAGLGAAGVMQGTGEIPGAPVQAPDAGDNGVEETQDMDSGTGILQARAEALGSRDS